MLVHDIGQAIKGLGRVDIYCGEGKNRKKLHIRRVNHERFGVSVDCQKNALLDFLPQGIR